MCPPSHTAPTEDAYCASPGAVWTALLRLQTERLCFAGVHQLVEGRSSGLLDESWSKPWMQLLQAVPELAALGPVFKSSTPTLLTEEGTEYSVTATKHVTDAAVVFQFLCSNTVEEQASAQNPVHISLFASGAMDAMQGDVWADPLHKHCEQSPGD